MDSSQSSSIANLLVANLSRDLVLGAEEALEAGARRAFPAAQEADMGHRANVLGQLRHFYMNEAFFGALALAGASPSPIKGNQLVVGRAGIIRIGRFNIAEGPWYNARRSAMRLDMAEANRAIQLLVEPDLFAPPEPVTQATVFFVGVFSGSLKKCPDRPLSIDIAVPDKELKRWLFRESVSEFMFRYSPVEDQRDIAVPVLKKNVRKKDEE